MNNPPCKDCVERTPRCHADCDKYREWRKAYDEWKAMTEAEKDKYYSFAEYEKMRTRRLFKRYQRKWQEK